MRSLHRSRWEFFAGQSEAEAQRLKAETEIQGMREMAKASQTFQEFPVLLRLRELESISALARNASARIYIGFDRHRSVENEDD